MILWLEMTTRTPLSRLLTVAVCLMGLMSAALPQCAIATSQIIESSVPCHEDEKCSEGDAEVYSSIRRRSVQRRVPNAPVDVIGSRRDVLYKRHLPAKVGHHLSHDLLAPLII